MSQFRRNAGLACSGYGRIQIKYPGVLPKTWYRVFAVNLSFYSRKLHDIGLRAECEDVAHWGEVHCGIQQWRDGQAPIAPSIPIRFEGGTMRAPVFSIAVSSRVPVPV